MALRLHCCSRTSPFALLFPSYFMSTLPNSTTHFTHSHINAKNQVEGNGTFLSVSENTYSASTRVQQAGSPTSNMSVICSKQSDYGVECSSPSVSSSATLVSEHQFDGAAQVDQLSDSRLEQDDELLYNKGYKGTLDEYSLPTSFGKQESSKFRNKSRKLKYRKSSTTIEPFDICQSETESTDISETEYFSFHSSSQGAEDDATKMEGVIEGPAQRVLRPGMVLLKNYISSIEQITIVKKCRELGLRPGGFYHPGYDDGSKLRLQMMCLGMDWDPQTRKYQKQRRIDRAKPPDIPSEFHLLVTRAMHDALAIISGDNNINVRDAEEILPQMKPDICIVNFYSETGRLGLHQDRDESSKSLRNGLPIVSFSIGDAAEFLYGKLRDADKAEKIVLKSGDVLIFGGESRHVFHGISSIIPNSAPLFLSEHASLRPGRLNLTFRQH